MPETIGYFGKHHRVSRVRGKASEHLCAHACGKQAAQWATIHGRDGLDPLLDYTPLCAKCHKQYDLDEIWTPEHRQKMSDAHRGPRTYLSDEARAKLSAAARKRWDLCRNP